MYSAKKQTVANFGSRFFCAFRQKRRRREAEAFGFVSSQRLLVLIL